MKVGAAFPATSLRWLWVLGCGMLGAVAGPAGAQEGERSRRGRDAPADLPLPVEVTDVWFPSAVAKDGLQSHGAWLPIYVELKSLSGREELVVVEVTTTPRFEGDKVQAFTVRRQVDVSPGAPRRTWLSARVPPEQHQQLTLKVTVPVRAGETSPVGVGNERLVFLQELGSADATAMSSGGGATFAVLFGGSNLLQLVPRGEWFRTAQFQIDSPLVHDKCAPVVLPDTLLGYQPFDVVILRDFGAERLEPAQLAALRQWVFMGGFVVLAPSTPAGDLLYSQVARELIGERYVEPSSSEPRALGAVVSLAGRGTRRGGATFGVTDVLIDDEVAVELAAEPLVVVDPVNGKGSVEIYSFLREDDGPPTPAADPNGRSRFGQLRQLRRLTDLTARLEDAARLYVEIPYGRGKVGVVTFDDQAFAAVEGGDDFLKPFWKKILASRSGGPLRERSARFVDGAIVTALRDPTRYIGFPFIVALVVVYLVLVGPGIYFVLKRFDRLPWLIWVEPVVVVCYLAVVFLAAYVSKGVITKARQWTLISHREGESLAVRESYLAVFSGAEGDYHIGAPAGALLEPLFANREDALRSLRAPPGGHPALILEEDPAGRRRLTGLHLEQWGEGYAVNFGVETVDKEGGLQVDVLESSTSDGPALEVDAPLSVRITNRLPYRVLGGRYYGAAEQFVLPAIDAGATVEVRLERPALDEGTAAPDDVWSRWGATIDKFRRFGYPERPDVEALIERDAADYDEEWHDNLRERVDVYVLYRNPDLSPGG